MKLPFHGVQVSGDVLFAARGGAVHSFQLKDGTHVSSWRYTGPAKDEKQSTDKLVIDVSGNSTPAPPQDDQGPPAKRARLEEAPVEAEKTAQGKAPVGEDEGKDAANTGDVKGKKQMPKAGVLSKPGERPMVNIVTATKDGSYLVVVTSDKSIWVFEHDGQGHLKQLSCRTMPKRPCSVVLTPDSKDILAADKFGDVYAVPLLPKEDPSAAAAATAASQQPPPPPGPDQQQQQQQQQEQQTASPQPPAPVFTPSATELTVHTKRNRQALLDQHVSRTNPKAMRGSTRRVDAVFERHLLLGHVSLLTAVALARDARGRPYVLTADRDEHVRVSRGTRDQAHVVERFCLGHAHFVNRLCVPDDDGVVGQGLGHLLLSAGGDDEVFVWRWEEGRLLAKVDLLGAVQGVVPEAKKLAVTGLCCWPGGLETGQVRVVVVCERVPALFLFTLKDTGSLEFSCTIRLPGNPLDLGVVDAAKIVVAVDLGQEGIEDDLFKSLLQVERADGEYRIGEDIVKDVPDVGKEDTDVPVEELNKLLYSAETLRKTDYEDGGADAE